MSNSINPNAFIKPSYGQSIPITINDFVKVLEAHEGLFIVENIKYDNALYCGNDNIYFSYCFNYNSGKATNETLLIIDSILDYNDIFVVISQGKEYSISLKD